jgi:predicted NBD/HSP70 family sugar kinase
VGDVSRLLEKTKDSTLEGLRAAVEKGDAAASAALDWFVGIQAEGISNLIHTFNPKHIIIDGEVVMLGDAFLERLKSAIEQRVMKPYLEGLKVEFSAMGDNGALLGASAIVLREAISIMEQGLTSRSMRR